MKIWKPVRKLFVAFALSAATPAVSFAGKTSIEIGPGWGWLKKAPAEALVRGNTDRGTIDVRYVKDALKVSINGIVYTAVGLYKKDAAKEYVAILASPSTKGGTPTFGKISVHVQSGRHTIKVGRSFSEASPQAAWDSSAWISHGVLRP